MFKVLFLGGAYAQIPILKEARSRGYYIITCDYLPGNPGHKLADEYYNVSTTDVEGVLRLAEKIKPDHIIAYASDPAAPVASYVSEKLNLPGNPYQSVRILSEKDLFRMYLSDHGFDSPQIIVLKETENYRDKLKNLQYPFIIKPTDSSGSKGVSRITEFHEVDNAVRSAFDYSRKKLIIAEEFIDNQIADIHGDGFVVDGELIFSYLGDHMYNKHTNPYNPVATLWPSRHSTEIISRIEQDVADIIRGIGFKNGAVNIEARLNAKGKYFIMEIGPRSGGHFVPQAIQYATGFDMVKAILDVMEGKKIIVPDQPRKCSAYYAIHSDISGELVQLSLKDELKPFIKEYHPYIKPGDDVRSFSGANAALGILVLSFDNRNEMEMIMDQINLLIELKIKNEKY